MHKQDTRNFKVQGDGKSSITRKFTALEIVAISNFKIFSLSVSYLTIYLLEFE